MTVSYQYDVASSTSGGFTRLLFKWKGSVYKLVWRELIWFTVAFTALSILYRNVLGDEQRRTFERVVYYFDAFLGLIPLSFVLGVYVTLVVTRWWQQFLAIPWPDKIAHCLALYVTGTDEQSRIVRRTLARYLNLSLILVLRSISMAVKKRFPTLQHLVEGGFMTKSELDIYQSVPSSEFNTYWIPCTWFINLINEAKKNELITDNQGLKLLVEEFSEFRSKCGLLWSYDWVSIPLVYTQVVTLATYSFFGACVIGRQYVNLPDPEDNRNRVDLYVPISTILQFFFYMGLLKVAEALINPFGDDDEDFELNWMIDRHLKVCYLVVDTLLLRNPPLVKDAHYDDPEPTLAYTKASMMYKKKTFRGSVAAVLVPEDEQTMFLPEILEEEEENGGGGVAPDLSSSKHSNSILNILNWTASAGNKMLHPKRAAEEHGGGPRTLRSMSICEDDVEMATSGVGLPPTPRPSRFHGTDDGNNTSGIRGFLSTPLARSSESLVLQKVLDASSSKAVRRGDSFPGAQPPPQVLLLQHHATPSGDKSRSLDMGQQQQARFQASIPRLRDLKRKRRRKFHPVPRPPPLPLRDSSSTSGDASSKSASLPTLHLDSTVLHLEEEGGDEQDTDEESSSPERSVDIGARKVYQRRGHGGGPEDNNGTASAYHQPPPPPLPLRSTKRRMSLQSK